MKAHYTGRNIEITKAIESFTEEKIKKLEKYLAKITEIHVMLSVNKHRKFFAYLHYLDVHAPYAPPPEYRDMFVTGKSSMLIPERVADWRKFKKKFDEIKDQLTQADIDWLKALYDAEIRALDDYLAALFSRIADRPKFPGSSPLVTLRPATESSQKPRVSQSDPFGSLALWSFPDLTPPQFSRI